MSLFIYIFFYSIPIDRVPLPIGETEGKDDSIITILLVLQYPVDKLLGGWGWGWGGALLRTSYDFPKPENGLIQ